MYPAVRIIAKTALIRRHGVLITANLLQKEVEDKILKELEPSYIDGLSLLGGEPFEPSNQRALVPFLKRVREKYSDKTIWCYSGYLFDKELLSDSRARCECTDEMLSMIDVLVDGEFVEALHDISLAFRGSSNQRIIDVKASLKENKIIPHKLMKREYNKKRQP